MIDAKREILNTILGKTRDHEVLRRVQEEDIEDILDHLFDMQFKPNDAKTKKFFEEKISSIAAELVRDEELGD